MEYARANSNKTVQRAFAEKFSKRHQEQSKFGVGKTNSKTMTICAEQKDLDDQQHRKGGSNEFAKQPSEAPKSP